MHVNKVLRVCVCVYVTVTHAGTPVCLWSRVGYGRILRGVLHTGDNAPSVSVKVVVKDIVVPRTLSRPTPAAVFTRRLVSPLRLDDTMNAQL